MQQNEHNVTLLFDGCNALKQRLSLIREAQKRICVQTFLWRDDSSGRLILRECMEASKRGVKVCILIDYWVLASGDSPLQRVFEEFDRDYDSFHVRLFNPLHQSEGFKSFELLIKALKDFSKAQKRMHGKLFLSEDQIAIVGGRNIGNEYFDLPAARNFIDCDACYTGSHLDSFSTNFDSFWNSIHTISISEFNKGNQRNRTLQSHENSHSINLKGVLLEKDNDALGSSSISVQRFSPDTFNYIFDMPEIENNTTSLTGEKLTQLLCSASASLHIFTPYLIFPPSLLEQLQHKVANQTLSIKILTNSLITADNLLTYAAAASRKSAILDALSCNIYELAHPLSETESFVSPYPRPDSENNVNENKLDSGFGDNPYETNQRHCTLHAKVYVIDRKTVCIGAINLDPRSFFLNTERFVQIDCEECAEAVLCHYEPLMSAGNSWVLAPPPKAVEKDFKPIEFPSILSDNIESFLTSSPLPHCFNPKESMTDVSHDRFSSSFYEDYESCGPFPGIKESDRDVQLFFYRSFAPLLSSIL